MIQRRTAISNASLAFRWMGCLSRIGGALRTPGLRPSSTRLSACPYEILKRLARVRPNVLNSSAAGDWIRPDLNTLSCRDPMRNSYRLVRLVLVRGVAHPG